MVPSKVTLWKNYSFYLKALFSNFIPNPSCNLTNASSKSHRNALKKENLLFPILNPKQPLPRSLSYRILVQWLLSSFPYSSVAEFFSFMCFRWRLCTLWGSIACWRCLLCWLWWTCSGFGRSLEEWLKLSERQGTTNERSVTFFLSLPSTTLFSFQHEKCKQN